MCKIENKEGDCPTFIFITCTLAAVRRTFRFGGFAFLKEPYIRRRGFRHVGWKYRFPTHMAKASPISNPHGKSLFDLSPWYWVLGLWFWVFTWVGGPPKGLRY